MRFARDLLFRGRGAHISAVAPAWLVRLAGGAVGASVVAVADELGLLSIVGMPKWAAECGGLIIGLVLAPTAVGALLWLVLGALTATLFVVMFTPLTRPLAARYVRADAPTASPVDAVLVLSGGLTLDGRITGQAVDRLLTAMALVRLHGLTELALSVTALPGSNGALTSEADQRALVALALPGMSPRFVRNVHSTRDEALAFAALGRTHGWRRVAVVTSPLHTARACATIEATGLSVECRPADGRDYSLRARRSAEGRRLIFADVLYEWSATALYRARGWM
ncbi:MAG: YdcF family protein [Gemmatimonadaceae bacterium]|nr:YdcF family protein [Gemmatimonadaceae bacterium]